MSFPTDRLRKAARSDRLGGLVREASPGELRELVAGLRELVNETLASDPVLAVRAGEAAAEAGRLSGEPACLALGLHTLGRALWVRGRYAEAARAFHDALPAYRKAGDRCGESSVRLAQVSAHAIQGDGRRAAAAARAARRLFEEAGDEIGLAKLAANLGNLHHRQDRPARAVPLYREARDLFLGRGMKAEAAAVALNLANVLALLDEYREAESLYGEAVDALEELGRPAQAAQARYNRAYLHFLQGRYAEALDGFRDAAEVFTGLSDPVHEGLCHLDRAEVYLRLQMFPEAEQEAGSALADFESLGMEYEAARAGAFLALARRGRGFRSGVLEGLERARSRFRNIGNQTWMGVIDQERAALALETGRLAEAGRLARSALRAFRASRLPVRVAAATELLARVEEQAGRPEPARKLLRSSVATASRTGSHWNEAQARLSLARSLRSQGKASAALGQVDRALERLEFLHATAPPGAWEESLAGDRAAAYREAASTCFDLVRQGRPEADGRAFLYAERARARTLVDRLAFLQGTGSGAEEIEGRRLLDRLTRVRQDLWWQRGGRERPDRERPWGGGDSPASARRTAALEEEAASILETLETRHPAWRRLGGVVVSSPDQVCRSLPPDTALLEYLMGEEETILFVLDREGLRVRRLAVGRPEVLRHLQGLQFQMNKFGLGAPYARRHLAGLREAAQAHLRRLGDLLLGGVEAEVQARHWVVAPHDVLHYVPFHALRPGGRWLLEERQVSVAPSASAFRLSLAIQGGRAEETSLVMGVGGKGLPGVDREVEEVAGLLPSARLLRDREATWEALRTESARCRFLHLSTHGIYRPDNPGASALKLADRWLTVREVGDMRLRSDLVVLSACHTGLNRILSGDEQTGLGRAFLQAGAPALVTTLWAVQDRAMSLWMSDFYRALLSAGAGGPAAALREASLLARERDPHPYFWAPCLLVGNPGPPAERSVAAQADTDYI